MGMKAIFRADASPESGSGHVMRISAIAEEFIAQGIISIFVGKIINLPWVSNRIRNLGFAAVIENENEYFPDKTKDILIVDSYELSVDNEFLQPHQWKHVVSIFDDLTPEYQADLSIHHGMSDYLPRAKSKRTIGGALFFPLRKSIQSLNPSARDGEPQICIVGGGSDLTGFVPSIAQILQTSKTEFKAKLFTDQLNLELDDRFSIFPIGADFDAITAKSELVFSTASTTSLEFIARGAVVGVGCSVKNQETYYLSMVKGGFAAAVGEYMNFEWVLDSAMIFDLVNSWKFRELLKKKSTNVIDKFGSARILNEILRL